jgi:hypothetical protein
VAIAETNDTDRWSVPTRTQAARNLPDGFVNTLMIQNVLDEPEWASVLGEADQRGITPLCTRT